MAKSTKTASKTTTASPAARKPRASTKTAAARPTEDQIRQRAYEIFLAEGGQPGNDLGNWLRAEEELQAPTAR